MFAASPNCKLEFPMVINGNIRAIDMRFLNDLFEMRSGYVLDFSNRTFAEFFQDELGIDIDNPCYDAEGTSKAKRLRYFLRTTDQPLVIRTLVALWEYRETNMRRSGARETIPNAEQEFGSLIERLGGERPIASGQPGPAETPVLPARAVISRLSANLVKVSELQPQARGYAFERFLKELFDEYGLSARASFRNRGEQIDGSFDLNGETYLLEAKWTDAQVGASDMHAFNGKVEDKAPWSRGLFVSNSGFSEDGLIAFGRGKKVVCMDGLDLYEMLNNGLAFTDVLLKKVRRAAETGLPFVRVRNL